MLCPSCFEEKGSTSMCRHCGFDESVGPEAMCLPFRHELKGGSYIVGRILGSPGGFGVAYKAWDTRRGTVVVVKEFLGPKSEYISRSPGESRIEVDPEFEQLYLHALDCFRREAAQISKVRDPYIVEVTDVFRENNTCYYVMPFVDCWDLRHYLPTQGGVLPQAEVLSIARDLLSGLKTLHAENILHCDIKPSNILLTKKKKRAILIDFGAARRKSPPDESQDIMHSKNYAPPELLRHDPGSLGDWTDIYLLCATLYELLSGRPPPQARARAEAHGDPLVPIRKVLPEIDPQLGNLVDRGLALAPAERPRHAAAALDLIGRKADTRGGDDTHTTGPSLPTGRAWPPSRAQWLWLWPAALLFAIGVLAQPDNDAVIGALPVGLMLAYVGGWAVWVQTRRAPQPKAKAGPKGITLNLTWEGMATVMRTMRPNETLVIGKSRNADICIQNDRLSREHVRVTVSDSGEFTIDDLKSTNHTFYQANSGDPPEQWQKIASVTAREGRFMLGVYQDEGVQLDIRQTPGNP